MRRIVILLILAGLAFAAFAYWNYERNLGDNRELIIYGNVDIRQAELGFRVEGRVKKMFFEEGELVQPGQLMAYLDQQPYVDEVKRAKAELYSAKVALKNAEILLKRRRELVGSGSVSQEDLDDAIRNYDTQFANVKAAEASLGISKTRLKDTLLFCPSEGTILTRIREPGTVVEPSVPIYGLSIKSPVWVRAYVNEPNLARIYPGMKAEVFTDTKGTPVYEGHIGFISPVSEFTPKTVETTDLRTDLVYRLRVVIDNPDQWLRQGMPVTVRLLNPLQPDGSNVREQ